MDFGTDAHFFKPVWSQLYSGSDVVPKARGLSYRVLAPECDCRVEKLTSCKFYSCGTNLKTRESDKS